MRPTTVIVTVDALRADAFEDPSLFPATNAAVARCVHFTTARSNAPFTWPSLTSMHMGVYPSHIRTPRERSAIAEADFARHVMSRPPTIASALGFEGGYNTGVVFPPFHATDFTFLTGYAVVKDVPFTGDASNPPARTMLDATRKLLASAPADKPAHVRVHLMDMHAPYVGGSTRAAYERSARALDGPLAEFLAEQPEDRIVVLSADHGEAFGEHGFDQHGWSLYEEELRVPLVLCVPRSLVGTDTARTVDVPVSLVDLAPTILDLTGVDVPYHRHGETLVPLFTKGAPRRIPWFYAEDVEKHRRAFVHGCKKLILEPDGYELLFDLCVDPHETRDLSESDPAAHGAMRRELDEVVDLDLDAFRSWRVGPKSLMDR
ncbi:MAG: sulfatase-like hydrolase/transferase [Polyangiaceae bacterium]